MRERENFTYIPNLPWMASKNKEHFIKNCFLLFPFPQWLLTQSPNICERNRMIFLTPGDLNWESGLLQDPKERVVYASQSDELLGLWMVGNLQVVSTCLVKEDYNVVLEKKVKARTSFTNNHTPHPRAGASIILDLPSPDCQGGQCWAGQALLGGSWPVSQTRLLWKPPPLDLKVTFCLGWSFSHLPPFQAPTPRP